MGRKQTPAGAPKTKWEVDPISAVNEHYHQIGRKLHNVGKPVYSYGIVSGSGLKCTLEVPYPAGTFVGIGPNTRIAKFRAAYAASKKLFR